MSHALLQTTATAKAEKELLLPQPVSTGYIPALDGLRALSIAIVLLSHFGFSNVIPGTFGVTVFFFVSGFLITRLLVAEFERSGTIKLRNFYVRRALRLYPAFLLMVVLGSLVYILVGGRVTRSDFSAAILYWANYHWFSPMAGNQLFHPFTILWSLSIEEHYYLVFPFLVLALAKRPKVLTGWIVFLIIAVTAWRFHVYSYCGANQNIGFCQFPMRIEHGTDTRIDSILFGSLFALIVSTPFSNTLRRLASLPAFVAGSILLLSSFVIRSTFFRDTTRYSFQGVGLTLCIAGLLYGPRFQALQGLLGKKWLTTVGRWSYSLYLWHYVLLTAAGGLLAGRYMRPIRNGTAIHSFGSMVIVIGLIAASFALACGSYYAVELPMGRARRRFGSHTVADSSNSR